MRQFAGYTVQGKFREGRERDLYRGLRDQDGAPVIIKVPRGERPHPRELSRLRHEYTILQKLQCAGVARAYALLPDDHGLALVVEDLRAPPLSALIGKCSSDLRTALWIAHDLALILSRVHAQGVIHRDIKPVNILVDDEARRVSLIDFGAATRLSQELPAGSLDVMEGTLAYMAPEQTGRLRRAVDHRSDLYSFRGHLVP